MEKELFLRLKDVVVHAADKSRVTNEGGRRPSVDGVMHTCGKFAQARLWSKSWAWFIKLDEDADSLVREAFGTMRFDVSLPKALWPTFKGLWPHYLDKEIRAWSRERYLPQEQVAVLEFFSPGASILIEELAKRPEFTSVSNGPLMKIVLDYEQKGLWLPDGETEKSDEERRAESIDWRLRALIGEKMLLLLAESVGPCEHFRKSKCKICADGFFPQDSFEIARSAPPIICANCAAVVNGRVLSYLKKTPKKIMDETSQRELFVDSIRAFVDSYGFIPSSDFRREDFVRIHFLAGGETADTLGVLLSAGTMPDAETAKRLFGSWAHLLDAAELLEGVRSGQSGYRSIASDSHLCLSLAEREICEFFSSLGVAHEREVNYPQDNEENPKGLLRSDFKIDSLWVEFAGRMDDPAYAEKIQKKRRLAEKAGLQLEVVFPETLRSFLEDFKTSQQSKLLT